MFNCRKVHSAQKKKRYVREGKGPWFRTPLGVGGLVSLRLHGRLFAPAQHHMHFRQVTCSAGRGREPGPGCLHSQSWLSRFYPLAAHSYSSTHTAPGRAPAGPSGHPGPLYVYGLSPPDGGPEGEARNFICFFYPLQQKLYYTNVLLHLGQPLDLALESNSRTKPIYIISFLL